LFLTAVRSYQGEYPKVRDLKKLVPSLDSVKLVTILKYLIRSGTLLIDSDSNIIWTSGGSANDKPEPLTLAEVAEMSDDFKKYLE
jgi:hypothetical protein